MVVRRLLRERKERRALLEKAVDFLVYSEREFAEGVSPPDSTPIRMRPLRLPNWPGLS
jgi:hypothetical protein